MTGFAPTDPIQDLLFRLESDLSEGHILASSKGLLLPDGSEGDVTACIEAAEAINNKLPGHKRIVRLILRYAALQGGLSNG